MGNMFDIMEFAALALLFGVGMCVCVCGYRGPRDLYCIAANTTTSANSFLLLKLHEVCFVCSLLLKSNWLTKLMRLYNMLVQQKDVLSK